MRNQRIIQVGRDFIIAFVFFQLLVLVSGSEVPMAVVVSGSMEPVIYRGDVILLYGDKAKPFTVGEIVTFQVENRGPYIVHRIIEVNGTNILTKGDNNKVADNNNFLYKDRISAQNIKGRVWLTLPRIALPFTWIIENPMIKYSLLATSVAHAIFST